MRKTLVAYFSASGVTEDKARELAGILGADLFEIAPKKRYTSEDLDWMNKRSRSTVESKDPSARPEIAKKVDDIAEYDTVVIGFPIWWYTAPRIINTFIEENDLRGKKIYLFATSGGSGADKAEKDLAKEYPELSFEGAKLLNGALDKEAVKSWISKD